jgi:tripartite-type tricarboxylate transporter receptor subunit TctC
MTRRVRLLALRGVPVALLLHLVVAPVFAQTWPTRPLHLIVGQAPGGHSDVIARIVAQRFSELLRQPVVVENRGGAGGTIGADAVARAPADGYTLLFAGSNNFGIAWATMKDLRYTIRDFVPVGTIARVSYGLAVHPRIPARTIAEFVAFARAHPGQLNYGSSGAASTSNLLFALLCRDASIDVVHVPYRGSAITLNELVAGRVDAIFTDLAALVPLERSGQLRIIAVVGARSNMVPDVRTATEQGYPNLAMEPWYGIAAPADTPRAIVAKLAATLRATLETPEVRQRFARSGYAPLETSSEGLAKLIATETATFKALVDQAQPAVQ